MGGQAGETVKVGLAVLLAIGLIWGALAIFRGEVFGTGNTYAVNVSFDRAVGVGKGMSVKIAGSNVGYVDEIKFDNDMRRTVAVLRIHNGIDIREDSYAVISQDGLIDEKYLAIYEKKRARDVNIPPGGQIDGTSEAGMNDLIANANEVLGNINSLLSDDQLGGLAIMLNQRLGGTLDKVDAILTSADGLVAGNKAYVDGAMQNVYAMSKNLLVLSQNLEDASGMVKTLASDPKYAGRFDQVTTDMAQISANINHLTGQLDTLVSDPQLQADAKDSVKLTKETLAEAKATLQRFQKTLDNVDGAIGNANGLMNDAGGMVQEAKSKMDQLSKIGDAVDVKLGMNVRAVDTNRGGDLDEDDNYVGDMNLAIGYQDVYLQVGAENIGEQNDFNFLMGYGDLNGASLRGGVYRSELGLGAAYNAPGGWGAQAMLYDTRDPKLNALGYIPVGKGLRVVAGAEDITGDPQATAGIGVEF
jgi:phospholipid/cholesterol/gamma-HCH transport system substrate-binding protein